MRLRPDWPAGTSVGPSMPTCPIVALPSRAFSQGDEAFEIVGGQRVEIQGCSADNGGAALRRGRCSDQGDRDQSTLMFAARMTLAHFSVVSARSLA